MACDLYRESTFTSHITTHREEKILYISTILKGFKYFEDLDTLGGAISETFDFQYIKKNSIFKVGDFSQTSLVKEARLNERERPRSTEKNGHIEVPMLGIDL